MLTYAFPTLLLASNKYLTTSERFWFHYFCLSQVLGVPVDNVYEKLAKDPMMTKTFDLGNQEHFNDDFKNEEEKFTYLVPTDNAWEEVQQEMATAHKVGFFLTTTYKVVL